MLHFPAAIAVGIKPPRRWDGIGLGIIAADPALRLLTPLLKKRRARLQRVPQLPVQVMRALVSVLAPSCPTHMQRRAQPMGLLHNVLLSSCTCSVSCCAHGGWRLELPPAWVRGVGRRVARCQPARGESHCSPFSLLGHCSVPGGGSPLHPAQLARTLAPSTPTVPSCSGCSTWSRVVTQPNLHPCSGKAPVSHK